MTTQATIELARFAKSPLKSSAKGRTGSANLQRKPGGRLGASIIDIRHEYPPVITAAYTSADWDWLQKVRTQVVNVHDGDTLGCVVFLDPEGTWRSQILVYINKAEIDRRKWYTPEAVCVHEAMHVVQFIELYINERLSQEGEAYLLEDISSQLVNAYKVKK